METQPSAQSFFQILSIENGVRNTREIRYYFFEVLSTFTVFLQIVRNILARIVCGNKSLAVACPHLFHMLNFWVFSVVPEHFSKHNVNIKQVSPVKSSRFNGFVLALFCILVLSQNFRKLSPLPISCFLKEVISLRQNWYFSLKVEASLEEDRTKKNLRQSSP